MVVRLVRRPRGLLRPGQRLGAGRGRRRATRPPTSARRWRRPASWPAPRRSPTPPRQTRARDHPARPLRDARADVRARRRLDLLVERRGRHRRRRHGARGLHGAGDARPAGRRGRPQPPTSWPTRPRAPAQLGLPAWAGGDVEGFLFPSTYRSIPASSATDVLGADGRRVLAQASDELSLATGRAAAGHLPARGRDRRQPGAGRGQPAAGLRQGGAGHLQPARRRHEAAAGLHREVRRRAPATRLYTTPEERRQPVPLQHLPARGAAAGGDQLARASGRCGPRSTRRRATGCYFVTVDLETGRTLFAETYREHQRNVAKLDAYCADSDLC